MSTVLPEVSILIAVFNEEQYITEALKSVINQIDISPEIIIVDDGSQDSTIEKIREIDCPQLKLLTPGKIGKVAAYNLAFKEAKGKWIGFFSGDDILLSHALKTHLESTKSTAPMNQYVASISQLQMISKDTTKHGTKIPRGKGATLAGITTLFSRKLSEEIFPIPPILPNEDLWASLTVQNFARSVIEIPLVTALYRIHTQNSSYHGNDFSIKSNSVAERYQVYPLFLKHKSSKLSERQRALLRSLSHAEELRKRGLVFHILLTRNLSLKKKLSFISYANNYLYHLRNKIGQLLNYLGC